MNNKNKKTEVCNWCGQQSQIIYVHGHGQCSNCGINVDECCRGENESCSLNPQIEKEENHD